MPVLLKRTVNAARQHQRRSQILTGSVPEKLSLVDELFLY
jgi:hypothetical protein